MKVYYLFSIGLISVLGARLCGAATTGLTSTYQPKLEVVLDETPADANVVIRAHHVYNGKKLNKIYPCTQGICTFKRNHHKNEADWRYFVEHLKKAMPNQLSSQARHKWYRENKKGLITSTDVTSQIQSLDLSGQQRIIDYVLTVQSKDQTAVVALTDQGEYDPLQNRSSSQQWFGFSAGMIRLFGALLAIMITYVGFRYIPVSVHHH